MKTILFLASNPKNTEPLRLHEEFREIEQGLKLANSQHRFRLIYKGAVRFTDIRRAMLEYDPEIVHFSGHGAKTDGIILEDDDGCSVFSNTEVLADFLGLFQKVECLLFNACYSDVQAEAFVYHINYVIGVRHEIDDKVAIGFSVAFYDAIGANKSVEFAYEVACSSIKIQGCPEYLIPVLRYKHGKGSAPYVSFGDKTEPDQTETMDVIIKINRDFNTFNTEDGRRLLHAIRELLKIDADLTIKKKRQGCVELTIELPLHQAKMLRDFIESGKLKEYDVISVELVTNSDSVVTLLSANQDSRDPKRNLSRTKGENHAPIGDQNLQVLKTQELLDILHSPHVSKEARENAIEAIYRRYSHDILHIIQAKVSVIEDVWDIHSDVWQIAFERLRRFAWQAEAKTTDPLKSWLLSIAYHKMQEYWREYSFDPVELIDAHLTYFDQYETLDGFAHEYSTGKSGEFQERMDMLLTKAQRSLGPLEQKVILLTYYSGKNSREIGELLQITPENVRTCRHRAIKRLREFFEQQGKRQEQEIQMIKGGGHATGRE